MAICSACLDHFIPNDYRDLCNSCGGQLMRQFEAMQEFRAGTMTIAELRQSRPDGKVARGNSNRASDYPRYWINEGGSLRQ